MPDHQQPTCTLFPGKEKRVYQAQTWIYRSEIAKADTAAKPVDKRAAGVLKCLWIP